MFTVKGNQKAWLGSLMTVVAYLAGTFGIGEAPSIETLSEALVQLGGVLLSWAVGYLAVWLKSNRKEKLNV